MSESAKALVSDLGAAIGFGNMMTLASQCWREMLLEKYGTDSGAFTVGPCVGSSEAKERAAKDARIAELEASVIRLEEEKAELNGLVDAQALEIEDLREARSHMAQRIAELESKLSALTTRQPMETAPRDGKRFVVELAGPVELVREPESEGES